MWWFLLWHSLLPDAEWSTKWIFLLGKDAGYVTAFIILAVYFGNFDLMTLLEANSEVGISGDMILWQ